MRAEKPARAAIARHAVIHERRNPAC